VPPFCEWRNRRDRDRRRVRGHHVPPRYGPTLGTPGQQVTCRAGRAV
jgi:hypothetical protein